MRRLLKVSTAGVAALAMAGFVSAATVDGARDTTFEKIKPSTVADSKISEGTISLEISGMT